MRRHACRRIRCAPSLRAHFFRHNLTAILLAALSLAGAAVFWTLLYFAFYWLTLLALTIRLGDDAHTPAHFPLGFAAAAFGLCFIAAVLRWLRPHELAATSPAVTLFFF